MMLKLTTIVSSFLLLTFSFVPNLHAQECFTNLDSGRKILEIALDECQKKIEETEVILQKQQADRTNTEYDILLIDQEINKALFRIRSSDIIISKLRNDIITKESAVEELGGNLQTHQKFLESLLQRINEIEQDGFINLLLSDVTLSSFFTRTNEYTSLRANTEDSIQSIDNLRERLVVNVSELEDKKISQNLVRLQQNASANQIKYQKDAKQEILNTQLNLEDKTKKTIDSFETRVADINNRLFELRGSGSIPFEDALNFAEQAYKKTGVRPAFILGLIKHESDLGKNVGRGTYLVDMHPTRDRPIFPYIANLLGFKAADLRVSARPGFGWGGAMGPAQFIPSTWVCYGGLINIKTNTCSKNSNLLTGNSNLSIGSKSSDVRRLQKFLNDNGFIIKTSGAGSPGNETTTYTNDVANAVKKFQEKHYTRILRPYGYTRGTGIVGPSTRAAVNEFNFYSGPWKYDKSKDVIRNATRNNRISNPWSPRDAFFASSIYLSRLGAASDECTAARRYYAGGNWRTTIALNYCRAVESNARLFQRDIDFLKR